MDSALTATRDQILASALELFQRQGYDATSLREIADRLQLTKAAVYYHFPAKEQLILELSRPFLNALSDLVTTAAAPAGLPSAAEHQAAVLRGYLELLIQHHSVVNLLVRDARTQNHPDVGQRARTLFNALANEVVDPDSAEDRMRVECALSALSVIAAIPSEAIDAARPVVLGAALAALHSRPALEWPAAEVGT